MSDRKLYSLILLVGALLLLGLTAIFNRVVDPFWYYRDIAISGFNTVKPKFRRYERHVKPSVVQREQPASLIFGSSYAEIGFDPLHPALLRVGKSYNFALAGAAWEDVYCQVQYAFAHDQALRQIVIGIHPQAMPRRDCTADMKKMAHPDESMFLLSLDALKASIGTVMEQNNQPSHTAEGLYLYTRNTPGTMVRFREHAKQASPCQRNPKPATTLDLEGLREIVRQAAERNIVLKLVVYPRHALWAEWQYRCQVRSSRWQQLAEIAAMIKQQAGKNGQIALWSFEGYHAFATEAVSDASIYWQDPAHFNTEFGNVMLDEMFGLEPARIGKNLSAANVAVAALFDQERDERAAFLASHPDFSEQLRAITGKQ